MTFIVSEDADLEIPPFPVRRWSVGEYQLFSRLGILDEDDQLELLDGWIAHKMTKNPRHDGTVDEINRLLSGLIPAGWYVRTQNVLLTPDSAPEPDLAVVRGVPKNYLRRHPTGADVALVIEVADSSVERDRLKAAIYARAGVPTYWLVNLVEDQIEVYREINGAGREAGYGCESVFADSSPIPLCVVGAERIEIPAANLLP